MATLREVRRRISGIKTTQKITRAMKMVAAAKLRRAQMAVVAARPYAGSMKELLAHLAAQADAGASPLMASRPVRRVALVTVTSDRGMCGAFNSNLERAAVNHIAALKAEGGAEVVLFCIGRKGADYFARRQYTIGGKYIGVYSDLVFGQAQAIARQLVDGYLRGDVDRVDIIYNEFKNVAQQRIVIEQFLPVTPAALQAAAPGSPREVNYIYEPSAPEILPALLPKFLNFQIWRILLESNASEEGARMTAMENATENANDLITQLQLQYNKARQAAITKELLEIVSGAEALGQA